MKVGFRLVGHVGGFPQTTHFTLAVEGDRTLEHQRRALRDFRANCPVRGYGVGLQGGSGMVTLSASEDQLTSDMVATLKQYAEAALDSIK